jgi:hypothetical protein
LKTLVQKTIFLTILFTLVSLSPIYPQTSFGDQVQKFADAMNETLPFAADLGLNWSSPYVGQLLGYPVHFGIGIGMGAVFMNNTEPAALGDLMGITIEDSFVKNKQWLPNYVLAARLGGFADIPFDIGLKFGYLPEMALWGSLEYYATTLGVEINYALINSNRGLTLTVGGGFDRLEGGVAGTVSNNAGLPSGVTSNMPAYLSWESNTIKVKANIAQPILVSNFTAFGGLNLGYSMNQVGVKFGDDRDNPQIEDMRDVSTLVFSGSLGLGLEVNVMRFDLSLMANLVSFELGFNFGVRFQR